MQGHTSAYILKEILFERAKLQVAASRFFFLVHSDLEELSTCSRVLDLEALALGAFAPGEDMTKRACNVFFAFWPWHGAAFPFNAGGRAWHDLFWLTIAFLQGKGCDLACFSWERN